MHQNIKTSTDLDFLLLTLWDIYAAVGRCGKAVCALQQRALVVKDQQGQAVLSTEDTNSHDKDKDKESKNRSKNRPKSIVPFAVSEYEYK